MSQPKSIRVVVRADSSSKIGTGHIFRCMALCDELRVDGWEVLFICRDAPGHIGNLIVNRGYQVEYIPNVTNQIKDADFCLDILKNHDTFDWLWVDHYKLGLEWEIRMKSVALRVIATDDLADRRHDVDVLLDYTNTDPNIYDGLLPNRTLKLIGYDYILLRREFFQIPKPQRNFEAVFNILVTLGGNDPDDVTSLVLDAVDHPDFSKSSVHITLGTSNIKSKEIGDRAHSIKHVTTYLQHNAPSELMLEADICIGAGGMTSWERNYLGLPSLVVSLAPNQVFFNEKMEKAGIIKYLGEAIELTVEGLRVQLLQAMKNAEWRKNCSYKASALVDGNGVYRLLDIFRKR